jgi:hypothetical protein
MKKITLFAFAIAALSLASCKKDRSCTCTWTSSYSITNSGSNTSTAFNTTGSNSGADAKIITKSKKSVARPNCLSTKTTDTEVENLGTNSEYTTSSTYESTCTLK